MKKQTKAQQLNNILNNISERLNLATTREQAEEKGLKRYLEIEFAPVYGGYRIVNVNIENGGHSGAFRGNGTEPRLKFALMEIKLISILQGIQATQAINN